MPVALPRITFGCLIGGLLKQANIHVYVDPGVNYSTNLLPGGQEELLFPILLPKQQ
jgi:hypothetical protein